MTPSFGKSPQAFLDLDDIAAFIGLDNPEAAIRFLEFLEQKMRLIATSPRMGRLYPELGDGIRGFPVEDYLIFYRETRDGIEIARVLHGARDIVALFQKTR